jgi:hypothetical protein
MVGVLSSRMLLRPSDLDRNRRCYRDMLGLAICREFGPPDVRLLDAAAVKKAQRDTPPPSPVLVVPENGDGEPGFEKPR